MGQMSYIFNVSLPVRCLVEVLADVGHAGCYSEPLSQRASAHIHEVQARSGVALQVRVQLAEVLQIFYREEAGFSPGRV